MLELIKKITAHILRHTFAINMLYNGCDLVTIKELLGHNDISVTARAYIFLFFLFLFKKILN